MYPALHCPCSRALMVKRLVADEPQWALKAKGCGRPQSSKQSGRTRGPTGCFQRRWPLGGTQKAGRTPGRLPALFKAGASHPGCLEGSFGALLRPRCWAHRRPQGMLDTIPRPSNSGPGIPGHLTVRIPVTLLPSLFLYSTIGYLPKLSV